MNKEELEKEVSLLPKNTSLSNLEKINLKALCWHGSDQGLDRPMTSYIARLDFRRFLESGLRFSPEEPARFWQADFSLLESNNAKSMRPLVSSKEQRGLQFQWASGNRA